MKAFAFVFVYKRALSVYMDAGEFNCPNLSVFFIICLERCNVFYRLKWTLCKKIRNDNVSQALVSYSWLIYCKQ